MQRRLVLYSFLLLFSVSCAAQGLGDWQNKTPGGLVMGDPGSGAVLQLSNPYREVHLRRWYFYRKHIVAEGDSAYLVVDEQHPEAIHVFQTSGEWRAYIAAEGLGPGWWTRWYTDNWRFYETIVFGLLFLGVIGVVPMLILLIIFLNKWIRGKVKVRLRSRHVVIAALVSAVLMIRWLLDEYPQSF
ncbi:MAG: hypothetical protein EOP50_10095 [Sphingobacteriales bacterium]|nr:MAG: hypothetical protein EOP50_10095 [Sphingobacteriales bacterium]